MLLILLAAGLDAVRLLGEMRAENKILRDAALERSHRLASIRSYVLLSQAYMGDYLMDPDAQGSADRLAQMQSAWSGMLNDIGNYRTATLGEAALIKQLRELLEQWSGRGGGYYANNLVPLRTALLEITTRVEDVDARQVASAEAGIQSQFENLGRRLSGLLQVAIAATLLLAFGTILYILRIERQNKLRYQEVLEGRGEMERLSAKLVAAQEEERRSISRELHDEVGQTLSAVLVDAANLANRIPV